MNSNLFRYSNRFMAVAAAAVVFASCEKDQFTEKNALDLDLMRLRTQDSIANVIRTAQYKHDIKRMQYQRMIDSLAAIDAAGRVYYSVIPYNGTLGVAASGGRVEGIASAKATAFIGMPKGTTSADGKTYTPANATTMALHVVEATTKNGVYAFPAMYSGEVTVSIEAPGFSTLNYTANLTPDGPVANGKIVYVGNVVPLFELPTTETAANFTKTARIQGRAWVEKDLTNGVEEQVATSDNYAVTVQVDTERGNVFRTRFINEANDEGSGVTQSNNGSSSSTKSGFIQRFAYEFAERGNSGNNVLGRTRVVDGAYAVLAPASMSGLPIKLEFDEYATDRTFFRNDQVVTARHIYGPNVASTMVENGVTQPSLTFQAVQTAAVATVTYTPSTTNSTLATGTTTTAATGVRGNNNINHWGLGVGSPVVVGAGGTGATATISLSGTDNTNYDAFKGVVAEITAGGTGYTSNANLVQFTYTDHLTIGTLTQQSVQGGGGIAPYIRVRNGGFNFFPHAATSSSTPGQFTNRLPDVLFTIGGQSAGQIAGVVPPTASVVIDQTVGAVSFVSVTTPGSGFGSTAPSVAFAYESQPLTLTANQNTPIFITANQGGGGNPTGALLFYTGDNSVVGLVTASVVNALNAVASGSAAQNFALASNGGQLDFTSGGSLARYTFVPSATFSYLLSGNILPLPAGVTAPTFGVVVNTDRTSPNVGAITRITMTGGTGFQSLFTGTAPSANVALSVSFRAPSNSLAAYDTQLTGTGLNNYFFDATPPTPTGSNDKTIYTLFFSAAGSNIGNTDQNIANRNSALAAITASPALVVAALPTANIANPRTAYGVPVYDNGVIAGIRMLDGGSGYVGGTNYALDIIPNPFWIGSKGHVSIAGNEVRVTEAGVTVLAGSIDPIANNATTGARGIGFVARGAVEARYNVSVANKQGSIGNFPRTSSDASVTVTLTNQGAGYAEKPNLVIFDGGLSFNASSGLSAAISNRLRIANTNTTGTTNTTGAVEFFGGTGGGFTAQTATSVTFNGAAVPGNAGTDAYNATTIKAVVIDKLGETLTEQFANRAKVAGDIVINELGQIARIDITPGRMIPWQTVAGAVAPFGPTNAFNTAKGWEMFTPLTYNVAPTLVISSPTGSGAVAVINPATSTLPGTNPINTATGLDPVFVNEAGTVVVGTGFAHRVGFRIRNISVTNGGTGYQQGNWYHRSGFSGSGTTITGLNRAPYTNAADATQNFRVIGGVDGANTDLFESNSGERNDRFDVFPGNTYVRDIHLGTGKEVE